jgi:hypothetical protein
LLLLDARRGLPLFGFANGVPGQAFTFSPDGRLLIASGGEAPAGGQPASEPLTVWDMATGQKVLRMTCPSVRITALALSRSGRQLLAGTEKGAVLVWDLLTNKEVGRLIGHRASVCSLDVSPDGQELASGSEDTTILLWRIRDSVAPRPRPVPAVELKTSWDQLASGEGLVAYRAAWGLAEAEQAVPFLVARLRPVRPVAAGRLARLIADLDDDQFPVREHAEKELAALEDLATPALQAALRKKPSLELALRAKRLLERSSAGLSRQQALVLSVLEEIGSPGARRLLQELARGARGARLTREAAAAGERLAGRGREVGP